MQRSLAARDGAQALSDIKCLVESIASVILEIDGTPADPAEAFKTTVGRAYGLLKGQPATSSPTTRSSVDDPPSARALVSQSRSRIRG